ncbi:hypothetical protein SB49_04365 [Sediminicola sp. YIK13]|uniref:DUF2461 domain-containing protein n=1 Tax=Sediminicola sp. YIK13 TaxID=1453352 RepID=UPI0007200B62|nr:DUF2461 domain-containing protein [Sediminicola sp. YIK13]ALM07116.1 hypothetical protein SB49_04365 [Sediminicola sp. YIK13]
MQSTLITKDIFDFLKALEKNNNREWFTEHKSQFKALESKVKDFCKSVLQALEEHDEIEKLKMFRIYRDVRFSKDKTPYKGHFACSYSRLGASLRGGYYIRLKPGESFIAVGFWEPNKDDLLRIRKELETDSSDFREILNEPTFKKVWGDLQGEELKTAPKGFDKEDPNIDLIRKKQFIFVKHFSDQEVFAPDFRNTINESFKAIRPYFDLISEILTTNLNGETLLG